MRYCDECQRTVQACDEAADCNERYAREYLRSLDEWEASPDYVEGVQY